MIYFPNRESLIRDIAKDMQTISSQYIVVNHLKLRQNLDKVFFDLFHSINQAQLEKISVLSRGLLTNAQQRAEDEKPLDGPSDNG